MAAHSNKTGMNYCQVAPSIGTSVVGSEDQRLLEQSSQLAAHYPWKNNSGHAEHPVRVC